MHITFYDRVAGCENVIGKYIYYYWKFLLDLLVIPDIVDSDLRLIREFPEKRGLTR